MDEGRDAHGGVNNNEIDEVMEGHIVGREAFIGDGIVRDFTTRGCENLLLCLPGLLLSAKNNNGVDANGTQLK